MGAVSASRLKNALFEMLNRAAYGGERIIVACRGRPKAAVLTVANLQRLEEMENARTVCEALSTYQVSGSVGGFVLVGL